MRVGRRVRALVAGVVVAVGGAFAVQLPSPAAPAAHGSRPEADPDCRRHLVAAPPAAAAVAVAAARSCLGVRPGAAVLTPVGRCSFGFLWNGSDGHRYIATAGHCILEERLQEVVFPPGKGPVARDSSRRPVGEFAYAAFDGDLDLALIRLYPGVPARAQVCRLGGPTGVNPDPLPPLTTLGQVGQGTATGPLVPARTQVVLKGDDLDSVTGLGLASPGDSGGPVIDRSGRAVGAVVATGANIPLVAAGVLVHSVRVAPAMGRASSAMEVGFTLATSPLAPEL